MVQIAGLAAVVLPKNIGLAVAVEVGSVFDMPRRSGVRPDRPHSGQVHAVHGPDRSLAAVVLPKNVGLAVAVEVGSVFDMPRRSEVRPDRARSSQVHAVHGPDRSLAARRRCAIIVGDGADALTVADGGAVGRIRQNDVEGLVRLHLGVAIDRDRDRLRVLVGPEMQRVGGRDIVAVGDSGGPVGGGVVHVKCCRAAAAGDREGCHLRPAVALADRDVVDRDRARNRCRRRRAPTAVSVTSSNRHASG